MRTDIFKSEHLNDLLAIAAISGKSVYENELNKLKNIPLNRESKVTTQLIFKLYFEKFKELYEGKIRQSIIDNVEAMIACKDLSKGYLFYGCSKCPKFHLTGFSCHSRFCTSCGKKYRDNRSSNIQKKLLDVGHRHFVFSVPFNLRPFFWKCRKLFDCLFDSVKEAFDITINLSKKDQTADFRVGYVAFLHTSGRSLNNHPHLHVLLAERLVDKFGNHKNIHYFPFKKLKKAFMFKFLNNANDVLKEHGDQELFKEFNKIRNFIPKKYKHGFYVYGPANKNHKTHIKNAKDAADYISRYASHPPIAESNILALDDVNHEVTWTYTPHEAPRKPIVVKEHVFKFIAKLIRHIPDNKFHVLRYYGFYANRASSRLEKKRKLFNIIYLSKLKTDNKWRIMIKNAYKYDPLLCECGATMVLDYDNSYFGDYEWRDFND